MSKGKKKILFALLGCIGIVAITIGATFAFYSYSKNGSTENSITSGGITFHYQEVSGIGNGIALNDAMPMSDNDGKAQTGIGKVFDFRITSRTTSKVAVPYEITARLTGDDIGSVVKVYLTRVRNGVEEEVLLSKYSELTQSTNELANGHIEKTLFTAIIPPNTNYNESYRLRIWLDDQTNFSGVPTTKYYCDGTEVSEADYNTCSGEATTNTVLEYPYNNKSFSLKVNAYANGRVLESDTLYVASDVAYSNNATESCTGNNATVECAINELKTIIK